MRKLERREEKFDNQPSASAKSASIWTIAGKAEFGPGKWRNISSIIWNINKREEQSSNRQVDEESQEQQGKRKGERTNRQHWKLISIQYQENGANSVPRNNFLTIKYI